MNIKALRAFRCTLTEGSLTAAAQVLHLSQPAISRLISGLEAELKLTLFSREGRHLTPTREGLAFYREAGRILDHLDEVPRIAADIRAGQRQSLRIVSMPRLAHTLAAPAVARFMRDYPEIHVSLDVRARREASTWLLGREYDIGIGVLPVNHPSVRTKPLLRVQAQAVLPLDHHLAKRTEISAVDLVDEKIIRLMQGMLLRDQLDDIFHAEGLQPIHTCEVGHSPLACALVAEGGGVTIADELVVAPYLRDQVSLVPITPARWMTFGLLYPNDPSATACHEPFETVLREWVWGLAAQSNTLNVD